VTILLSQPLDQSQGTADDDPTSVNHKHN
ncbi:uncharacterized protein METZ01_LOCUS307275, partial [marine metagenome]